MFNLNDLLKSKSITKSITYPTLDKTTREIYRALGKEEEYNLLIAKNYGMIIVIRPCI